jgi:hypothetical protein
MSTSKLYRSWLTKADKRGGIKADFTQGIKGCILGVEGEREKIFSICPKLLVNAELYGLVLASRLKKETNQFVKPICEVNVSAFINFLTSMFEHLLVT